MNIGEYWYIGSDRSLGIICLCKISVITDTSLETMVISDTLRGSVVISDK